MTHRVEQIMVAFEDIITGLSTAGTEVERDAAYAIGEDVDAAINLNQGACVKLSEQGMTLSDWELSVETIAIAKETSTEKASTVANRINNEICVALDVLTTPFLGLSWVIKIEESDSSATLVDKQSVPIVGIKTTWLVQFRRSMADPGA